MSICITFGEQSENHVGMQKQGNGLDEHGYSLEDLEEFKNKYGGTIHDFGNDAYFLHIPNLVRCKDELLQELLSLEWDKKYWDRRRSKVLNKRARYNLCFGDTYQQSDYENGKGTIIPYDKVIYLNSVRSIIAPGLQTEGNYYYKSTCGIGYHGDSERKKVIGVSLGADRPLRFKWFNGKVGEFTFILKHGDVYVMSEKCTGWDWKKRNVPTIRHAAGEKYI